MSLVLWVALFIIGIAALVKSADYFTDAAEKIGLSWGIPPFIVGVTIVSIGTSLPELASSIVSVLRGASEVVAGNVIGSNIANIFLVLAVAAILAKQMKITYEVMHVDLPLLVGTAFLLAIFLWDGQFSLFEAILSLAAYVVYFSYTIYSEKKTRHKDIDTQVKHMKEHSNIGSKYLILFLSAIFLYAGAELVIKSLLSLSSILNIGTEVIAVTAVAFATSLPELMVVIQAARKHQPEIAVGNVLGSNIFNATVVMGIPALFGKLTIAPALITFSLPLMVMGTILMIFMVQEKRMSRWEGYMLLIFYVYFLGSLF